ncbi:hypothetical protein SMD11_6923 [Streptomyces albireticuli]|uniref:Uncharacterized protein n=2 Tax=Streptomyces TaxID=1883 RepID=A0A1Z2LDX4_9ACTN|nr:hypothetical protein [Streptomyces albireticuli]ARZ72499.1 hypothetical protein SMD11_6923 [Streptomyces albireticuli]
MGKLTVHDTPLTRTLSDHLPAEAPFTPVFASLTAPAGNGSRP